MRVKHTFNKIDASESVQFHANHRLEKLIPHLTKQHSAHFVYKIWKHEFQVDLVISGHDKVFRASAKSNEDFYATLDICINKLSKQLAKRKDKLQHHRHQEHSRVGHLDRMSDELDIDFSKMKGVGSREAA